MLNLTKKEREMIAVFFACGYDNECYTCHLCFSHADKAVLASLIKKGVFKHNGLRGIEARVYLIADLKAEDFE